MLLRHAYNVTRDWDDAEDIVQELFAGLWEKRLSLPTSVNLASYLYASVRNAELNKLAHEKVIDRFLAHAVSNLPTSDNATEDRILENELAAIIEREVDKLPARMREVFILSRNQGLSNKEIAQLLHITEGTAKLQISKALKILRENIATIIAALLMN